MKLRFEYSLSDSRGYVFSILLLITCISIIFLRAFESHDKPVAVQRKVPFRHLLVKQEIHHPDKGKGNG